MCQCRALGRERPWVFACQLRPRRWHPGRSRRSRPSVVCHRRCPFRCHCRRARGAMPAVRSAGQFVQEDPFLPVRQIASSFWRPCMRAAITQESLELCSAACKARRFAPTTRVVRAWPSGLDAACAQLTGRQLRDGLYVRLERTRGDACVRKSPAGCVYRIGGHDVRDCLAVPGVSPSSIGSAHVWNAVANGENLPSDLFALVADKRPAHGLRPCASCRP